MHKETTGGKIIDFVSEYAHLSHIISDSMDDKHDNTTQKEYAM